MEEDQLMVLLAGLIMVEDCVQDIVNSVRKLTERG